MHAGHRIKDNFRSAIFGLTDKSRARLMPVPKEVEDQRGLSSSVRFFVDYTISVAVNAVARRQALRAKLLLKGASGLTLSVMISTLADDGEVKFVAYSSDTSLFLSSTAGLFVINQTPRELEHSIYLYLSEGLTGEETVSAEVVRETQSEFGLPVLVGCSDDGPRSLHVKQAPSAK